MNDTLLETVETIRAGDASPSVLFDGGPSIRARTRARAGDPSYKAGLVEAARIVGAYKRGSARGDYLFREALSTSDFPLFFGDILDRTVLAKYRAWDPSYQNYVQMGTLRDFRTAHIFAFDGAESVLTAVPELTEYPAAKLAETQYSLAVTKYGRRLPFSWEAGINDDRGLLDAIPLRFANAARRSEEKAVTQLFVDANGPHASFYTLGNKNTVVVANGSTTANPALSVNGLQDAMRVLAKQVDVDGEPIFIEVVELVVPPSLEITAQNIMNSTAVWLNEAGGSTNTRLIAENWMRGRVRINVNPYIPVVASVANGAASWFLFASTRNGDQRPAIGFRKLAGHEEPEIFIREPDQRRVGGGQINPLDGDFLTDAIQYKGRHVFGAGRMDPKMTVASNGSGV